MNKINTSLGSHFIKDNILYVILNEDADIDIEMMKESEATRVELQKGEKIKVFVDARKIYQITSEAREYASGDINTKLSIGTAVLIKSLSTRLIVNFFIKVNKPIVPTKMFKSEEEALIWLNNL